jgi:hypothetical protein
MLLCGYFYAKYQYQELTAVWYLYRYHTVERTLRVTRILNYIIEARSPLQIFAPGELLILSSNKEFALSQVHK